MGILWRRIISKFTIIFILSRSREIKWGWCGIEDYSLHACWKMGYIILTVLWVEQYVRICWSALLTTAVVRGLGQV